MPKHHFFNCSGQNVVPTFVVLEHDACDCPNWSATSENRSAYVLAHLAETIKYKKEERVDEELHDSVTS